MSKRDGLNSGRDEERIAPCRWCDERYTPSGIEHHQQWCDENPHPGITYEHQLEHEIPPVGGDGPIPDLANASSDDGVEEDDASDLPPVEVLPADAD